VPLEGANLSGGRRILGEILLGQARDAEREATHPERAAVLRERQLDAPAPDVDQQVRAAVQPEGMAAGAEDESRLLRSGDDLDRQPRLASQLPAGRRY
jgi:hypothetical protein